MSVDEVSRLRAAVEVRARRSGVVDLTNEDLALLLRGLASVVKDRGATAAQRKHAKELSAMFGKPYPR